MSCGACRPGPHCRLRASNNRTRTFRRHTYRPSRLHARNTVAPNATQPPPRHPCCPGESGVVVLSRIEAPHQHSVIVREALDCTLHRSLRPHEQEFFGVVNVVVDAQCIRVESVPYSNILARPSRFASSNQSNLRHQSFPCCALGRVLCLLSH